MLTRYSVLLTLEYLPPIAALLKNCAGVYDTKYSRIRYVPARLVCRFSPHVYDK